MTTEILAVLALMVVRLGVPLVIILALSYVAYRWIGEEKPSRTGATTSGATIGGAAALAQVLAGPHCWDAHGCTAEMKATCPAAARPELPCWLAIQMKTGHLKQNCFDCNFYERPVITA